VEHTIEPLATLFHFGLLLHWSLLLRDALNFG
jgi:hypothetical protein